MDKKKIGAGFVGALQKAADAAKAAKLAVQDMAADAKQSREKKKADAQKAAAAKGLIAAAESEKGTAPVVKSIATRNALQIIYYLMAADGTVYHSEEEKFDAIGAALDPNFADSKPAIIKDCQAQLEKVIDSEDYYDVLQDGVEDAIQSSNETADTFITPKLLVWDLLTIAYSDESYDETERKLLKYIVRKLQIDKAVFLEMESSILTILDIEKEIAGLRKQVNDSEAQLKQIELDLARHESNCGHIREQLQQDYQLDEEAARGQDFAELQEMDLAALQKQESRLTLQIADLGPINAAAIEEYNAVKERSEFLCKQYNDLCTAKENLEAVIAEINSGMTKRFKEAFAKINEYFAQCYVKIFGGGTAVLRLTEPDNLLDSGIDIDVQPPGKKLQSLYLMSGGERALTVIALLFALLSYQPSPFCILDEIDAPLDDANIQRFADFLRDYAGNTQFIVITHRKGTMECADIMYGVTMEESGVSKLLSVKINAKENE